MPGILSESGWSLPEARLRATRGCEEERETFPPTAPSKARERHERGWQPSAVLAARHPSGTAKVHTPELDQIVRVERVGSRSRLRVGGEEDGGEEGRQGWKLAGGGRIVGRGHLRRPHSGRLRREGAVLDRSRRLVVRGVRRAQEVGRRSQGGHRRLVRGRGQSFGTRFGQRLAQRVLRVARERAQGLGEDRGRGGIVASERFV